MNAEVVETPSMLDGEASTLNVVVEEASILSVAVEEASTLSVVVGEASTLSVAVEAVSTLNMVEEAEKVSTRIKLDAVECVAEDVVDSVQGVVAVLIIRSKAVVSPNILKEPLKLYTRQVAVGVEDLAANAVVVPVSQIAGLHVVAAAAPLTKDREEEEVEANQVPEVFVGVVVLSSRPL